jgi:hypothetical protein
LQNAQDNKDTYSLEDDDDDDDDVFYDTQEENDYIKINEMLDPVKFNFEIILEKLNIVIDKYKLHDLLKGKKINTDKKNEIYKFLTSNFLNPNDKPNDLLKSFIDFMLNNSVSMANILFANNDEDRISKINDGINITIRSEEFLHDIMFALYEIIKKKEISELKEEQKKYISGLIANELITKIHMSIFQNNQQKDKEYNLNKKNRKIFSFLISVSIFFLTSVSFFIFESYFPQDLIKKYNIQDLNNFETRSIVYTFIILILILISSIISYYICKMIQNNNIESECQRNYNNFINDIYSNNINILYKVIEETIHNIFSEAGVKFLNYLNIISKFDIPDDKKIELISIVKNFFIKEYSEKINLDIIFEKLEILDDLKEKIKLKGLDDKYINDIKNNFKEGLNFDVDKTKMTRVNKIDEKKFSNIDIESLINMLDYLIKNLESLLNDNEIKQITSEKKVRNF